MTNPLTMLPTLLRQARESAAALQQLNQMLALAVPFNAPHGFGIAALGDDFVRTRAPYRPENFNHIQGIHACGIATIAELSSGLLLMGRLSPAEYRLIMARLEIDYHYQAKAELFAESRLSPEELEAEILEPLSTAESLTRTLTTEVHDADGHLVATARVTWQIKPWASVRTQVA